MKFKFGNNLTVRVLPYNYLYCSRLDFEDSFLCKIAMILLIFLQRFCVASEPDCNVFTAQCFNNEFDNVKVSSKYEFYWSSLQKLD